MSAIARALIWLSWRQYRGLLALFTLGLLAALAYWLAMDAAYRTRTTLSYWSMTTALVYGLFVSATVVRRGLPLRRRSLDAFQRALPLSPRAWVWQRWLAGLVTLLVPVLISGGLMALGALAGWIAIAEPRTAANAMQHRLQIDEFWRGGWGPASLPPLRAAGLTLLVTGIAALDVVNAFTWIAALAARARRETTLGVCCVIVALACVLAMLLHESLATWQPHSGLLAWAKAILETALAGVFGMAGIRHYGYGGADGRMYFDVQFISNPGIAAAIHLVWIAAGLGVLLIRVHGPIASGRAISRRRWVLPALRWPRLPGRIGRHVWWELREVGPWAGGGLLLWFGLSVGGALSAGRPGDTLFHLSRVGTVLVTFWGSLAAVGILAPSFDERRAIFWRSRPISPHTWFWTKWLAGWLLIVALVDGASILSLMLSPRHINPLYSSWQAYAAVVPLMHTFHFCLALAVVSIVRRPAGSLAAVFLVFTVFTGLVSLTQSMALSLDPLDLYNDIAGQTLQGLPWTAVNFGPRLLILIAMTALALLSAWWLATRPAIPLPGVKGNTN